MQFFLFFFVFLSFLFNFRFPSHFFSSALFIIIQFLNYSFLSNVSIIFQLLCPDVFLIIFHNFLAFQLKKHFSWNNEHIHSTPFMDELVKSGLEFTQAYSTHRCSPTRAALLTGRYPFRYGLGSHPISREIPTGLDLNEKLLPEYLKEIGTVFANAITIFRFFWTRHNFQL